MKAFAKLGILAVSGAFFGACVDINLKSELPKADYYALDNIAIEAKNCEAHELVALEAVEIPQRLAGRNLTYKDGNRIHKIERVNLSDTLKANIETMLIKSFANHCIKAITPPFSGIKMERYLRVKMLDFGVEKRGDSAESSVDSAEFSAESSVDSVESSVDSSVDSVESSVDSAGDSTKKGQNLTENVAKISFLFVLHQNGAILQSGIITKTAPIENFNDDGIFTALQTATNGAIKTLTNKMIPK